MRKGSTRFSDAMRQTGGVSDVISHKPSKKQKKLNSVGEMDHSTSGKRVKLPKKFFDDYATVNSPVPRKLRSALKKGHEESVPWSSRKKIRKTEKPIKDGNNKKLKVDSDEQITKEEEEVMAALVAMAEICPENNKTEEINLNNQSSYTEASILQEKVEAKMTCEAPSQSKSKDLVKTSVLIDDLNESVNANTVDVKKDPKSVFTKGNKSRKRCVSHVYICQVIKDLKVKEGKMVNSHKEPKQLLDYPDVKNENTMYDNTGKITNEANMGYKTVFQDMPFFGNPLYDPSQWSRPVFPKQQMWRNPFIPPHTSSAYVQPSLHDVLVSKDALKTPQEFLYKRQFGHRSSGYDQNGSLFRVDNSPTLKLSL